MALNSLAAVGSRLYAVDGVSLRAFELSNPANPTSLGSSPGYGAQGIHVRGDLAFLGNADGGVAILDVSNASAPELLEEVELPGKTIHLAGSGNLVHLGDEVATVDATPGALIRIDDVEPPKTAP